MASIDDVMDKCNDILNKVADNKELLGEIKADLLDEEIKLQCPKCIGRGHLFSKTGDAPEIQIPCPNCNSTGYVKAGEII